MIFPESENVKIDFFKFLYAYSIIYNNSIYNSQGFQ